MFEQTFWDEFNTLRRSFDRVFDNFYTQTHQGGRENTDIAFRPAVETGWTDDHLNMRFVVPGVRQQDLKLAVHGSQLVLEGERHAPDNFGAEGTVNQQIAYGKFQRVIDLPNNLDTEHMQAHLHDGFLDVRIPLAQSMKPKQVQITAGEKAKTLTA